MPLLHKVGRADGSGGSLRVTLVARDTRRGILSAAARALWPELQPELQPEQQPEQQRRVAAATGDDVRPGAGSEYENPQRGTVMTTYAADLFMSLDGFGIGPVGYWGKDGPELSAERRRVFFEGEDETLVLGANTYRRW